MHVVPVIYETRPSDMVGVKLLLLSLRRHHPDLRPVVILPNVTDVESAWLAEHTDATLRNDLASELSTWNVKPDVLGRLVDEQPDETFLWIDSDIVLHKPMPPVVFEGSPDDFVVAEEYRLARQPGTKVRTRQWGYQEARRLNCTVNSCILRLTKTHKPLLAEWMRLTSLPEYQSVQKQDWRTRPLHMVGGQDILTGLLGSKEFAHIHLRWVRRGRDIAQCYESRGYPANERLANLFRGLPPFVHAQGEKPWREHRSALSMDVAPLKYVARDYPEALGVAEGELDGWTDPLTPTGRLVDRLLLGNPNLVGLPSTVAGEAKWLLKRTAAVLSGATRREVGPPRSEPPA